MTENTDNPLEGRDHYNDLISIIASHMAGSLLGFLVPDPDERLQLGPQVLGELEANIIPAVLARLNGMGFEVTRDITGQPPLDPTEH